MGDGKKQEKRVLFVCVENAGRSQMAEAFAARYGLSAASAGTLPSETVNPSVVEAMREVGIDISSNRPRLLTKEMIDASALVVTMGCSVEDVCPRPLIAKMRKKLMDWHIEDPKGKSIENVREIRKEIEDKVRSLASEIRTADDGLT